MRLLDILMLVLAGGLALLFGCIEVSMRRTLAALAGMSCPKCGTKFGRELAVAARADHHARLEELRRQRPGRKYRLAPEWKVVCAQCGATAKFNHETWELTLVSESEEAQT